MDAKFFEKDGKVFFSFIGKSHVKDVPPDEYVDIATEDHKKRFAAEYELFLNPPKVEEVKKNEDSSLDGLEDEKPAKKSKKVA